MLMPAPGSVTNSRVSKYTRQTSGASVESPAAISYANPFTVKPKRRAKKERTPRNFSYD